MQDKRLQCVVSVFTSIVLTRPMHVSFVNGQEIQVCPKSILFSVCNHLDRVSCKYCGLGDAIYVGYCSIVHPTACCNEIRV